MNYSYFIPTKGKIQKMLIAYEVKNSDINPEYTDEPLHTFYINDNLRILMHSDNCDYEHYRNSELQINENLQYYLPITKFVGDVIVIKDIAQYESWELEILDDTEMAICAEEPHNPYILVD